MDNTVVNLPGLLPASSHMELLNCTVGWMPAKTVNFICLNNLCKITSSAISFIQCTPLFSIAQINQQFAKESEMQVKHSFKLQYQDMFDVIHQSKFYYHFLHISGQQQTFRPFFDTRFTSGLLDFRRKSDPFSNVTSDPGSGYGLSSDHWSGESNVNQMTSYLTPTIIRL